MDTLSLAMSLVGRTDERVEEALEDMMEEMWGDRMVKGFQSVAR